MPAFLSDLGALASQNQTLAYLIIYIGTIFLGNISAFVSFWLVLGGALGTWGIPLLFLTLFLADLSGDSLWYGLGKGLRNTRIGHFFRNRFAPQHEKIEAALTKNGRSWIIASKFLYASSFPIIFTAGWVNFPPKKFFKTSLLSAALWLPIFGGVAYGLFAGLTPLQAFAVFKKFEITFLVGIGLFIVAEYWLAKLIKKIFVRIFKNGFNGLNGNGGSSLKEENIAGFDR